MGGGGDQGRDNVFTFIHRLIFFGPSLKIAISICDISLYPNAFPVMRTQVTNHHSFPLSENVFVVSSLLKEIFHWL